MKVKADKISRQYFRRSKGSNVFYAVAEMDFSLASGELAVIIGRSGSGKRTLLNMLAGILQPTGGQVHYDETDIYSLDDAKRSVFRNQKIGLIPQGQTGLQSLTVLENILLPSRMYADEDKTSEAAALTERLGIAHLQGVYSDELSGGEMRRLAIARALICRPAVLLADEPTGDLDDENTHIVLGLLREAADQGAAVLLVTHETEAAGYADHLYRMDGGVLTKEK